MSNDTFDRFYNEFKDWSKGDILRRTYNIILDDADKTRQIEQLESIIKEAIEECKSVIGNPEHTIVSKNELMKIILNILNKGSE